MPGRSSCARPSGAAGASVSSPSPSSCRNSSASLTCSTVIASAPARSAIVRATRSDRECRVPVTVFVPFFWLVNTRDVALIWLAMGTWAFAGSALYGITGVLLAELFEARLRYSGISFGYQMAGMLVGAPTPIIAAALIQWAGGRSWPVATYLAASALISLVAVCLVSETYRVAIHGQGSAQARLAAEHG